MKPRDAEATKIRILAAAREEFAMSGLGGARIDKIAEAAEANKQMIYHYFGSKDLLFAAVLEEEYDAFRKAEAALDLDRLEPVAALEKLDLEGALRPAIINVGKTWSKRSQKGLLGNTTDLLWRSKSWRSRRALTCWTG